MSENVKKLGSGAIIGAMVIFTLTGVFGWIGVTTAEVPALKAQSETEFKNLNSNIDKLTEASIYTNRVITTNSNKQDARMNELSNFIYTLGIEVKVLRKDCDNNIADIKVCNEINK